MSLTETTKEIQVIAGAIPDGIWGPNSAAAVLKLLRKISPTPAPVPIASNFDARTEQNLSTLQPGARRKLTPLVIKAIAIGAARGVTVKVICGLRNRADQEAAKRSGASKAGYGKSWHNYGMAIDFGCFGTDESYLDGSNPAIAEKIYREVGKLAPEYGIEWGGGWRSFKDTPHFHVADGLPSTPTASHVARLNAETFYYA